MSYYITKAQEQNTETLLNYGDKLHRAVWKMVHYWVRSSDYHILFHSNQNNDKKERVQKIYYFLYTWVLA